MSVEIEPAELGFQRMFAVFQYRRARNLCLTTLHIGPFTKEVSETLYLRNPNSDPVAFKVRPCLPQTAISYIVTHRNPVREYQVKTTAPKQ